MQVLYERCAAIDVGKDVIAVAVRLPGDGPDGRATIKRTFKTFYGVLAEAARWLVSLGVTHVAMEATGIYSMPVYHALIEHGDFAKVLVCNAGHVKNVPGRKTDLLTELRAGLGQVSGQARISGASVCRHDHWRRRTAGVVRSGGAAVRFA
jgi:transposase